MLSQSKHLIEKYLNPFVGLFKNVSPNLLTVLGSIPSLLFFVFVIKGFYIAALIAFVGTAFDMIDGLVARKYNKVTKLGGLLDSTFDRVSDFFIMAAFGFGGLVRWEIVAPVLLTSFLISYVRARAEQASNNISLDLGIMERTERLIVAVFALLAYMVLPETKIIGFNMAEGVFLILFVLSFYTVIQRLVFAYKHL